MQSVIVDVDDDFDLVCSTSTSRVSSLSTTPSAAAGIVTTTIPNVGTEGARAQLSQEPESDTSLGEGRTVQQRRAPKVQHAQLTSFFGNVNYLGEKALDFLTEQEDDILGVAEHRLSPAKTKSASKT